MSWRQITLILITLTTLLAVILLYLLGQALENTPRVPFPATASAEEVQLGRSAVKRTLRVITRAQPSADLQLSAAELEALPSLIARAYPTLHTRFQTRAEGLHLAISWHHQRWSLGRYLSVTALIPPSTEPRLSQVEVGKLRLPDALANLLLGPALDLLLGHRTRQALLDSVVLLQPSASSLTLRLTPPANPERHFSRLLERLRGWSGSEESLNGDWIAESYAVLLTEADKLEPQQWVSLTYFIAPLFRHVAATSPAGKEHLRARAAILALAIYLGDPRFEQLTGPVLTDQQRQIWPHRRTLLRQRADLRLHFIYSAAVQVLAAEGLSYALGELKELLDANPSGSGFSFADLAADRAGTLFAMRATADAEQARALLQRFDRPLREGDLMIGVKQLPEGIDATSFSSHFGDIASPPYQQLVAQIDQQLMTLRLYRGINPP
ncbi:hypothetical protein [Motiliproteus sediminis]|uniref:hypothetical protein n=1 Tax=Motiliproteus sediminis TaxID=1468178 RepID=UPI001AF008D8|nr:hypothetical protein [Motiliproteus sediminis]